MAGTITRNNFPRILLGEIKRIWGIDYPKVPQKFRECFEILKSDGQFEEYMEVSGVGLASTKNEGSPVSLDSANQGLVQFIQNTQYGLALKITREAIADKRYGKDLIRVVPELSKSVAHTMDITAFNILNRAFNNSFTYADGQPLCDTDKVVSKGGTYANKGASNVDLSELALENAHMDIIAIVGPDGLRMDIEEEALIIPPQLRFDAHRILHSTMRVGTADNDANAIRDLGMFKKVVESIRLTDTDAWFIKTNIRGGLIFQEREEPTFADDVEFLTGDLLYRVFARWGVGSEDQRGIYGNPGV